MKLTTSHVVFSTIFSTLVYIILINAGNLDAALESTRHNPYSFEHKQT